MSHRLSPHALACGLVLFVSVTTATRAADDFPFTQAQMQSLGVQVSRLERPAAIEGLPAPARVVLTPGQEQVVSAPLDGVVDRLFVSDDDTVRSGQPVLRLISPALGELQLRLMEAGSRARLSDRTLARERSLFAEGIVPERRVQEAEAAAAEDGARRRQAETALRMAGVDPASIRPLASGSDGPPAVTLTARGAGIVSDLDLKVGQRVRQGDTLMRIADPQKLSLEIQLPGSQRAAVAAMRGASVTGVDGEITASIRSVGVGTSENQVIRIRADVTRGAQRLRPGEFIQVRVPFAARASGWAVPLQSVVRHGEQAYVFVRTPQGFVATPVQVASSAGQWVHVDGPLQAGQEIAVSSTIALKAVWQGKGGAS